MSAPNYLSFPGGTIYRISRQRKRAVPHVHPNGGSVAVTLQPDHVWLERLPDGVPFQHRWPLRYPPSSGVELHDEQPTLTPSAPWFLGRGRAHL